MPKTIGPGAALVSSTITVPGNPRIADVDVSVQLNHAVMGQIDAHLRSPAGNDNGLFTDIGAGAAGGQAQMDTTIDDEAGLTPAFTVLKGINIKPELAYRLKWFDGVNAGGTWTLDLYDDTADANGGTLTGWSMTVCEEPPPPACPAGYARTTVFSSDFESGAAGFTHSGTGDQWALGTPNSPATTTTKPACRIYNLY
ncbi:MAG: proprotein convertase P-domain-containing protein [Chloracidobacterium sp.]|nr:proprotein convertase P-domain-containing protein [Chloracidobacterium sp.]